jgi:pimeloyl-ACP methyl ester carboxylesterase
VAGAGGPDRSVLIGQSIGAAAALRAALNRSDRVAGVVLAHSLGGMRNQELAALVRADRAAAEKLPVLDRLFTPAFRERRPDLAFLFRQMDTFNTATMQDLRNLNSDGPTLHEVDAAPFPVMLLAGEKDAVLSPGTVRRAGELLPRAGVEIVPGAPHSMYWETCTGKRRICSTTPSASSSPRSTRASGARCRDLASPKTVHSTQTSPTRQGAKPMNVAFY